MTLFLAIVLAASAAALTPRPTPSEPREAFLKMRARVAGLLDSAAENMSAGDEEAIAQDLTGAAGGIDSMVKAAAPPNGKPLLPAAVVAKLEALRDELALLAKKPAKASLTFRLPACLQVLEEAVAALDPPRPRPRPTPKAG